jgi:hypothetical protein
VIADIPTSRVETLPIGMRVVAHIPVEGVRLLSLADQTELASAASDPDGP